MIESEAVTMAFSHHGLCSEDELRFLYRLALGAPRGFPFVELGTYHGRTAVLLCAAAEETNSQVITIDIVSQEGVESRLSKLNVDAYAIIGDSAVVPDDISRIGLLFIDGEHTRERVSKELDIWLPLLVRSGILAFHDYDESEHGERIVPVIDEQIRNKTNEWEYLGLVQRLIGFRRL